MARKKAGGTSKSDLIRQTSAANPSAGPTEIAKMISDTHSIKVSAAMVSTVLSQDRTRGGKPARRGRPPRDQQRKTSGRSSAARSDSGGDVSVNTLVRVKKLAEELGGVEKAKMALDALSRILG